MNGERDSATRIREYASSASRVHVCVLQRRESFPFFTQYIIHMTLYEYRNLHSVPKSSDDILGGKDKLDTQIKRFKNTQINKRDAFSSMKYRVNFVLKKF